MTSRATLVSSMEEEHLETSSSMEVVLKVGEVLRVFNSPGLHLL